MDFEQSPRSKELLEKAQRFIEKEIVPIEKGAWDAIAAKSNGYDWTKWRAHECMEGLKEKARAQGLWNLFLPDEKIGGGLSVLEYAPIAEASGHSLLAPEAFNCSAPDTGNMEVLYRYGSDEQKETWLKPLLAGKIRSVFCMTEPDVASSDATNMQATAVLDGNEVVLSGKKWWSSGIGHPNAKVAIFMARTPGISEHRHRQHSMVLVPLDAKGVEITRMLPVLGDYDEPHGHGEVHFHDVRVPKENIIGSLGMGFEIAQGRLGPGRIHHCMRCIGAAEESLSLMIKRGMSRTAFGKRLIDLGGNRERVAEARIAIDQARLLTLYAAWKIDQVGALGAMTEISAIKVSAPNVLQRVVDDAMQMHGGAGVARETLLPLFYAQARMLRLADGPDEVHRGLIARIELAKHKM